LFFNSVQNTEPSQPSTQISRFSNTAPQRFHQLVEQRLPEIADGYRLYAADSFAKGFEDVYLACHGSIPFLPANPRSLPVTLLFNVLLPNQLPNQQGLLDDLIRVIIDPVAIWLGVVYRLETRIEGLPCVVTNNPQHALLELARCRIYGDYLLKLHTALLAELPQEPSA
jgi:hypothetical protein